METPALFPSPLSSVPGEVLGMENSFLLAMKSLSTAQALSRVLHPVSAWEVLGCL